MMMSPGGCCIKLVFQEQRTNKFSWGGILWRADSATAVVDLRNLRQLSQICLNLRQVYIFVLSGNQMSQNSRAIEFRP